MSGAFPGTGECRRLCETGRAGDTGGFLPLWEQAFRDREERRNGTVSSASTRVSDELC